LNDQITQDRFVGNEPMRGVDDRQDGMFSYISLDAGVPEEHPLRPMRVLVHEALGALTKEFEAMYAVDGRPSIAPERLLRASLLQVLYSVRSERLLCEQLDYNLLFRWFVGLSADERVFDHSTFSKNRDRLLEADIAGALFARVYARAQAEGLTSDEHFSVDGTLIDAWASRRVSGVRRAGMVKTPRGWDATPDAISTDTV
jgi:transposase